MIKCCSIHSCFKVIALIEVFYFTLDTFTPQSLAYHCMVLLSSQKQTHISILGILLGAMTIITRVDITGVRRRSERYSRIWRGTFPIMKTRQPGQHKKILLFIFRGYIFWNMVLFKFLLYDQPNTLPRGGLEPVFSNFDRNNRFATVRHPKIDLLPSGRLDFDSGNKQPLNVRSKVVRLIIALISFFQKFFFVGAAESGVLDHWYKSYLYVLIDLRLGCNAL